MNNKMKTFIIILSFVFVNLIGICGLRAQHVNGLADLDRMYSLIPDTLTSEAYLKQLEQVEMQFRQVMDTIQDERNQKIASLMRYKGLLWGLGRYVLAHDDASVGRYEEDAISGVVYFNIALKSVFDKEDTVLVSNSLNKKTNELNRRGNSLYHLLPGRRVPRGTGQQHAAFHIPVGHDGCRTEDEPFPPFKQMQPLGRIFRRGIHGTAGEQMLHLGGTVPAHHVPFSAACRGHSS